jgi:hypothetical protein
MVERYLAHPGIERRVPPPQRNPMKYLCLAYERESDLNGLSPEEWASLRVETLDYVSELREKGILIEARALRSATTASTVRVRRGRSLVTDGPFAESKEQLGGFFMIEVASHAEAVRVAERWPGARHGTIEVRPIEEGLPEEIRYPTG